MSSLPAAIRRRARPTIDKGPWRDASIVLGCALALRLLFAALTADTYDPDEFVVLTLSREVAHGAMPYQDFAFFHPPGILVLFRLLQPLVALWWPLARLVIVAIDCLTALLVWRIGGLLYGRREALAAGLIYAASPLTLLAGIRIGQDPIITALGVSGLLLLLTLRSRLGAALAGICLGLAIWFKYPGILFLPVYVLAAPRRVFIVIGATALTLMAVFAPFFPVLPLMVRDSFGWQLFHRDQLDLWHRLAAVFSFWMLLNPIALPAIGRARHPHWLLAGYALGGLFLLTSEVYYHYFVPVVPFAALLAARPLLKAMDRTPRVVLAGSALLFTAWAAALNIGPTQAGLSALRLSAASATVKVIDRLTSRHEQVLTDQFEYSYLARRRSVDNYFWDMRSVTSARTLERHLPASTVVVGTDGEMAAYPDGFVQYLKARNYTSVRAGNAIVWLPERSAAHFQGQLMYTRTE